MGVRDILFEFLKDVDGDLREVITRVLLAEQRRIDMKNPRGVKDDIRDIIDAQVQLESRRK